MLALDLDKLAQRFLKKLPPKQARQLHDAIELLLENPYPRESKLLRGFDYLRVHCGEYRIIYRVDNQTLTVRLIGKRNDGEVYRKLKRLLG